MPDKPKKSQEKQALFLFNSGKYKEAIELYKQLLKDTDNGEWRRQLAYCYLQRAKAFALKGMFKEALVLWENHREHAQPPYEGYDHYLTWLIQTKNPARIQSSLEQLTAQQLDQDYPELASVLGLMVLTEHPEFQQTLPQESAFISHLNSVQAALQAYRNNDPNGMEAALKQLPFRSAFRDFRTLLKAAGALSTSPAETQSLLAKIPANSPYSQTARLLLACTRKGSELAWELTRFDRSQRRLVEEIVGLNKKQVEFVEALSKQKDPLSDKIKFNLAIQFQALFGSQPAQRFCFAALATYPAGRRDYTKAFGAIDEFEENRLKALASERENNDYDAEYFWKQCVKALVQKGAGNGLKIALILRHIAQKKPPEERIATLIESLEHDPDDKDCYLQILRHYGQQPDAAEDYKQWLDKTLGKFPQDTEVLMLAVQAATRGKAYKKAIQYASKLLQIDPLNSFAKQVMFSSHLAHARKLIKTKKYHLVEAEIKQAEALKLGKKYVLQTQLMEGLLRSASGDKQLGLQAIAETLNKLNADPVTAHFQASVETLLTGLPVATVLRELPPAKDHLLSAPELARLTQLITQYGQEDAGHELLHKALEKIKAPLKQSVLSQNYDESLLLNLCQTLDSIKHFELLRHCAKWAQTQWQKPIWVYYRIYSETNDDPKGCSFKNVLSLQNNLQQARQEKDYRTAELIGRYLDRYYKAYPMRSLGFLDDLFDMEEPEDYEDPIDELFGHLPEEIFYKLGKKLESLTKKTSPERLVQELSKTVGNNSNILSAIMQDPELFTALMILKAAGELGIDIDVTIEDVLEYFDVDNQPRSFPFPF